MKGTEKQIAWATDILNEKNEQIKKRRDRFETDIEEFEKRGLMRPGQKDKILDVIAVADEWLSLDWSEVDAAWIIETLRNVDLTTTIAQKRAIKSARETMGAK